MSVNEKVLISVITVSYNAEKSIEKTIHSVINQTYKNIEYIVIDGGSTDQTVNIIKKYQDKISFWVSEKDNGIYDAMNKGISRAHGDYIALLNADDWYENDTCEIIFDSIKENKVDIYYGLLRYINSETKKCEMVLGRTIEQISSFMIAHPTCFISNKVYKRYLYNTNYKYSSDYDFLLILVENNFEFCFIEKILANFSTNGASCSSDAYLETIDVRMKHNLISKKEAKHLIFGFKKHLLKEKIKNLI